MHVIHKIQCFEEFLHYFALFFKKLIFPKFQPIEIAIKNVCESLSVSIGARLVLDQSKHFRPIEFVFRLIENCVENFFKIDFHVFKLTFSKVFNFFFLYTTRSRLQSNFLLFSTILFARFFSPKASKTFIPFILHLFSLFVDQIMHYLRNFEPMKFSGFFDELKIGRASCRERVWR